MTTPTVSPAIVEYQLAECKKRCAELEKDAERMLLRLAAIANWRERSDAYDADMGYKERRTYCEDVLLIEQAAQLAIDAAILAAKEPK